MDNTPKAQVPVVYIDPKLETIIMRELAMGKIPNPHDKSLTPEQADWFLRYYPRGIIR